MIWGKSDQRSVICDLGAILGGESEEGREREGERKERVDET